MKLKLIAPLLFIALSAFFLSSCDSGTDTVSTSLSGDAQIYSFKLAAKPETAIDTINYPYLKTTKFAIDQANQLIYNPDSLPYQTTLRKCAATITFASSGVSKVELIYPNDSVVEWNSTDSIDFSTYAYPRFKVTPANGNLPREYTVKILVHQVDPDTLIWQKSTISNYPTDIKDQRTLLVNNRFFTYTIASNNNVYVSKADKASDNTLNYNNRQTVSGVSGTTILLQSITHFNGKLYAADTDGKGYQSDEDGTAWTKVSEEIVNIVGILPTLTAETDQLIVITESAGEYYLAKTKDLQSLEIQDKISSNFPISGYTSVTNYDRNNLNNAITAITGGRNTSGTLNNLTWSIKMTSEGLLQTISNQNHSLFQAGEYIPTFLYDGYLYALSANTLYKTASYGYKWIVAPNKEILDTRIPDGYRQSVVTDSENFVWIFGGIRDSGTSSIQEVWRGRINKLNPKL